MKNKTIVAVVIILLVVILGVVYFAKKAESGPGKYDTFAQCLGEKGAKFYGTFWCPYCRAQKDLFGKSADLLPYIECSTLDGNSRLQICIDQKIEKYPTWEFADGERMQGKVSLEDLAKKTSCELPK